MRPTVELLESMDLGIRFLRPPNGPDAEASHGTPFPEETRAAIDAADASFFGSSSTSSGRALMYLRWGKETYANVRPAKYYPGAVTPLAQPDGLDFIIVRENLEDLYVGVEGDLDELAGFNRTSRTARRPLSSFGPGKFAVKAITEAGCERVIRFAFDLARRRRGQLTVTSKYNMLPVADGLFRDVGLALASEYPEVNLSTYIIDDFCHRMVRDPHQFDVVVMPNLYGDIMSDGAAALVGGLGMAPSGCYGDDYAYFESAHGTAPDIAGQNIINPTATILSSAMMLDHLGMTEAARRLEAAVAAVYRDGQCLTRDQGGSASTTDFCGAVAEQLK